MFNYLVSSSDKKKYRVDSIHPCRSKDVRPLLRSQFAIILLPDYHHNHLQIFGKLYVLYVQLLSLTMKNIGLIQFSYLV